MVIFRDLTGSYVSGNAFRTSPAWSNAARYIYQDGSSYTPGSVSGGTALSERNLIKFFGGTCLQSSSCAAPPVVVTDVTPFTVDIAWAPGNTETSWNLYYRTVGSSSFTSAASAVTATTYQFTGLLGGTNYEFMVVPVCSDSMASTVRATTECATISSLPFSEDFNNWGTGSGVLPNCWLRTGSYSSYPYIYASYNHTGLTGGSLYMYSSTGSSITSITLPALDTTIYAANQTQLVFYSYYVSATYGAPAYIVGVLEDPQDGTTFVPVDTVYHTSGINQWETTPATAPMSPSARSTPPTTPTTTSTTSPSS